MSALGLGTGGLNRLGQKQGRSTDEIVRLVRGALDLGIIYFDTAPSYMQSEALLGQALAGVPRDSYVVATKFHPVHAGELANPEDVRPSLERSLRKLNTDHVDVLLLHSVEPARYEAIMDRLLEPLVAVRNAGLARSIGISDSFERDLTHEAAQRALTSLPELDVLMIGFNMLSPNAVDTVLPPAQERGMGIVNMCAVRSVISDPDLMRQILNQWQAEGLLPAEATSLDWLLGPDAESLTAAAYKFAAQQPGVSCVLSGSASLEHLAENVRAIDGPPLADEKIRRLLETFGPVRRAASHPDLGRG